MSFCCRAPRQHHLSPPQQHREPLGPATQPMAPGPRSAASPGRGRSEPWLPAWPRGFCPHLSAKANWLLTPSCVFSSFKGRKAESLALLHCPPCAVPRGCHRALSGRLGHRFPTAAAGRARAARTGTGAEPAGSSPARFTERPKLTHSKLFVAS